MNIDRAAIVRDRVGGMTLTAVSKKWGVSRSLVCKLVNRASAGDEGSLRPPTQVVDVINIAQLSSTEARLGDEGIRS
jgi:transposase-like protein